MFSAMFAPAEVLLLNPEVFSAGCLRNLTLGRMNCSTGLYHTQFAMVPVLMELKRAVTTASCKHGEKRVF